MLSYFQVPIGFLHWPKLLQFWLIQIPTYLIAGRPSPKPLFDFILFQEKPFPWFLHLVSELKTLLHQLLFAHLIHFEVVLNLIDIGQHLGLAETHSGLGGRGQTSSDLRAGGELPKDPKIFGAHDGWIEFI